MRLFENANFDFMGSRKKALSLSGVLGAILLALTLYGAFSHSSWLNYAVDFTGGTLVEVHFKQPTSVAELREAVAPIVPGSEITRFGGENEFQVRAPQFSEEGSSIASRIAEGLESRYPADAFEIVRTEAVGPKVGGELQQKAVVAILLSLAATLVYLAFRFEWRFGVAAIGSTTYDVLITILIIAGLRLEVSLTTVAALLTVLGYSLNDTIIVFDRIRENLKKTGRRLSLSEIFNRSINETLPRTILTAGTTLATLLALFFFSGTELIREFSLILIMGIVIGTYSSIFIASPLLLYIEHRWPRSEAPRKGSRPARATV
jgi:preprotein translocase subunit SecF